LIVVLADLLVDISMKFPLFPVEAGDLQRLSHVEIGPGGANNIAIMAARLGLPVKCLGEVGDDAFGEIVLSGLQQEGIETQDVFVSEGVHTPVAVVLVDEQAEPAYLGSPGSLRLKQLPGQWRQPIREAQALFADGWIEHGGIADIILQAFRQARDANVPVFFDPGPMNPAMDNDWVFEAVKRTVVLLVNEGEAQRLAGVEDLEEAGRKLLAMGPQMLVLKRGAQGTIIFADDSLQYTNGFPVEVVDKTGAGDSLTGAVIFGYLKDMPLDKLGQLANLVGAAKVQKMGTGHNMPTLAEVQALAAKFDLDFSLKE
jgi:ribokinase